MENPLFLSFQPVLVFARVSGHAGLLDVFERVVDEDRSAEVGLGILDCLELVDTNLENPPPLLFQSTLAAVVTHGSKTRIFQIIV